MNVSTDCENTKVIPKGLCQCGCGERTKLAAYTHAARGWVRGEPIRYVHGHHARKLTPEYLEQDCGYKTPCWIWQRGISGNGYGHVTRAGFQGGAHRLYWEQANGPIPKGKNIDHLCQNPPCVNPEHLEAVHQAINVRRGRWAKLTEGDVREIRRRRSDGEPIRSLSQAFGVHQSHISQIANGRRWPEVTG